MDRKIKTRQVHKDIKVLDKTVTGEYETFSVK